jgi:hypothetical protein
MLIGLLAGIASAALFGVAAVAQAAAVRGLDKKADSFGWFIKHGWREPLLVAVIGAYLAGFVLHAVAIAYTPLYLAQATISLSLPITAWVASRRLGESLGLVGWSSVGAIAAGLVLLAVSAGAAGDARTSTLFAGGLWGGVCLLAVIGWQWSGSAPIILATAAGWGYAGSALAVRGVAGLDLLSLLCALAVPAYGALAFWLYSVALDRTTAAGASGSVIVYQTLVPSVVGLLWLGDGIKAGWEFGVLVGLLLAMVGALALGRRQDQQPAAAPTG